MSFQHEKVLNLKIVCIAIWNHSHLHLCSSIVQLNKLSYSFFYSQQKWSRVFCIQSLLPHLLFSSQYTSVKFLASLSQWSFLILCSVETVVWRFPSWICSVITSLSLLCVTIPRHSLQPSSWNTSFSWLLCHTYFIGLSLVFVFWLKINDGVHLS